jgi:hypothetical protein
MTKKKGNKKKFSSKEEASSNGRLKSDYMYPRWNRDVEKAVALSIRFLVFRNNLTTHNVDKEYFTHVMGHFLCANIGCSSSGWGSKKVAIVIKRYPGNQYNAIIYNQRCKHCDVLGSLFLDKQSYIDRVAYRLKKWADVAMDSPPHIESEGPPHKSALCEGCKRGVCREGGDI